MAVVACCCREKLYASEATVCACLFCERREDERQTKNRRKYQEDLAAA